MKVNLFIAALLLLCYASHGQSPGELLDQLQQANKNDDPKALEIARGLVRNDAGNIIENDHIGIYFFEIGQAFYNNNQLDSAILFLEKAIAKAHDSDDMLLQCKGYFELSSIAIQQYDLSALEKYNSALFKAAESIQSQEYLTRAYMQKGVIFEYNNQYDSALLFYEKSESMARAAADTSFLFTILQSKATTYSDMGQYADALILLDTIQYYHGVRQDTARLADVRLNMGVVLKRLGQVDAALELYFSILPEYSKQKYPGRYPKLLANIGILYQGLKNNEKAIEYFEKALENSENLVQLECGVSLMYSISAINSGLFDQAKPYLDKGLKLAIEHQIGRREAEAYYNYGAYYYERNKVNPNSLFLDSAQYYWLQAHDLYEDMGNNQGLVRSKKQLADLSLDRADYANAERYLLEAYAIANESEYANLETSLLLGLSEYYRRIGNYRKADFYTVKYQKQSDLNYAEELNEQLLDKDFYYQYLIKAKQDSLNHDNKLKMQAYQLAESENKLNQQYIFITLISIALFVVIILLIMFLRRNRQLDHARILIDQKKQEVEKQRDELKVAIDDLRIAQTKLVRAERLAAIGSLTHTMAHEINNPLNFIKSSAKVFEKMLEQGYAGKEEDIEKLFDGIYTGVSRISHIIKNLSHLDHKMMEQQQSELLEVVEKCVAEIQNKLPQHIDLQNNIDRSCKLRFEPGLLKLVIEQILQNAIEAIERDGVITLTMEEDVDNCYLTVEDNGRGMTDEVMQKAFDPFFSTKKEVSGVGLGLYTSYTILRDLGGDLSITSNPDRGTTVRLAIPKLLELEEVL